MKNHINYTWVGIRVLDEKKAEINAWLEETGITLQHWGRLALEEKLDRDKELHERRKKLDALNQKNQLEREEKNV
jgi:hypothetical protein